VNNLTKEERKIILYWKTELCRTQKEATLILRRKRNDNKLPI
jgi:hypothetical protein